MEYEWLSELVKKIKSVKIAVIGDFCLDAYFFIDDSESEISVETGLPTNPVEQHSYSLGGAGNLANNIASLEVEEVKALGAIGNDLFGMEMLRIMKEVSINTEGLFIQKDQWSTHVYCKPYVKNEEQSRFDFGNFNALKTETADRIVERLTEVMDEVDVVVINQQVASGIHTDYLRKKLSALIRQHPEKIFISDIRDKSRFFDGTCLKINEMEAVSLSGMKSDTNGSVTFEEACRAAVTLYEKQKKPVFVTCGSRGSLAVDASGLVSIPGLMLPGRVDPVGAGDSYLAGVAAALAAGYSVGNSARTGALVAGVTVQKLFQTGTATPEELLEIGKDPDYIYEPERAEDIRKAEYLGDSNIEIVTKWPAKLQVHHAIFDHDGTISTLREGWESIMAPMMIKAILGNRYETVEKAFYDQVKESVEVLIDKTTGIQTLAQMASLVDLVREYGLVPEEEVLDMHGYKEIYNRELLAKVRRREKRFRDGELSVADFTIKNAVVFLERLHDAGIILYLASGTDQEDVRHEAGLLGYDHLFKGGIYGSVGDIAKDAKKMVLEHILKQIGVSGHHQIVTFGDGPVEIRETKKREGRTVGLASNEVKRFGLNEIKRTRLIKAGADMIVPDFSQMDRLARLLHVS